MRGTWRAGGRGGQLTGAVGRLADEAATTTEGEVLVTLLLVVLLLVVVLAVLGVGEEEVKVLVVHEYECPGVVRLHSTLYFTLSVVLVFAGLPVFALTAGVVVVVSPADEFAPAVEVDAGEDVGRSEWPRPLELCETPGSFFLDVKMLSSLSPPQISPPFPTQGTVIFFSHVSK